MSYYANGYNRTMKIAGLKLSAENAPEKKKKKNEWTDTEKKKAVGAGAGAVGGTAAGIAGSRMFANRMRDALKDEIDAHEAARPKPQRVDEFSSTARDVYRQGGRLPEEIEFRVGPYSASPGFIQDMIGQGDKSIINLPGNKDISPYSDIDFKITDLFDEDKMNELTARMTSLRGRDMSGETRYAPSTILHEMGHLQGTVEPGDFGRKSILGNMGGRLLGPMAGMGLGLGMGTSENETMRDWAPVAAGAPMAPVLFDEGRASWNAHKMMKDMEAEELLDPDVVRKGGKTLRNAFGTYGSLAAAPVATSLIAREYTDDTPFMDKIRGAFE